MNIKGFGKFREKLPAFSGKKIALLPIYAICLVAVSFAIYFAFNSSPSTLAVLGFNKIVLSFFPLFGVVFMEFLGFTLVWQLWLLRDHLKEKYGPRAYQRAFPIGFAGIVLVITVAFNQYMPYYLFAQNFWAASPLQVIATPLETYLGIAGPTVLYLKGIAAGILLILGILMLIRSIQVFGADYMALLYLYFPEESQIQKSKVYSVIRHPTYAGVLLVALGGAFFTFTLLSFATYTLLLMGFYLHTYLVEEKELIRRFGNSYLEYRKGVPAFFVNYRNVITFLRFLFKKDKN